MAAFATTFIAQDLTVTLTVRRGRVPSPRSCCF